MTRPAHGSGLSAAEAARLGTFIVDLALSLRPGVPSSETAEGVRIGRKGSLLLRPDASWRDYEGDDSGRGGLSLIAHLLDIEQHDTNPVSALRFARKWLAEHPGDGAFKAADFDQANADKKARQRAQFAEQVLRRLEALSGHAAERYLISRALHPPYPACVAFLRDAREGESAVVGLLTMPDGTPTGIQLGFVDQQGRKSAIAPNRRIFNRELDPAKRRGAAFRILATPVPAALEDALGPDQVKADDDELKRVARTARRFASTTLIAEGLEDALSLHAAFPYSAIIGLPGIGALRHQKFKPGEQVIVVPDGDSPATPARRSLARGIDELLLQKADVRVAQMPTRGSHVA